MLNDANGKHDQVEIFIRMLCESSDANHIKLYDLFSATSPMLADDITNTHESDWLLADESQLRK